MWRPIFSVVVVLLFASSAFAKGDASSVPFRVYRGHFIVVEGSLANLPKQSFVIDTGVSPTMINLRVAQSLGLSGSTRTIHALMHDIDTTEMSLDSLTLGPIRMSNVLVVARDLTGLEKEVGVRVDALIGLDVLRQSSFTIRYSDNTILFGSPALSLTATNLGNEQPMASVALIVGNQPLRLIVDTGAADIVFFRKHIDILSPAAKVQYNKFNLGGELVMTRVPMPTAMLGNSELRHEWVYMAEDPAAPEIIDGLLGVSPQFFDWIAFDFEHRLLSWQLRDSRIPPITEAGSARCPAGDPRSMSWAPADNSRRSAEPCEVMRARMPHL